MCFEFSCSSQLLSSADLTFPVFLECTFTTSVYIMDFVISCLLGLRLKRCSCLQPGLPQIHSSYGYTNMFSIVQPEMRFNVIWPLPTLLPHFLGADEGISVDIIIKRFC